MGLVPLEKRLEAIENFYRLLDEQKDELAKTLTSERVNRCSSRIMNSMARGAGFVFS